MSEPPTHYQVSFTSRQALSLFVGLLAVLGLSYFFGLMTGLSGNEAPAGIAGAPPAAENASAESEPPSPTSPPASQAAGGGEENLTFPVPVTAVRSAGGPRPGPATTIHTFEDGEASASASTPPPARAATAKPAPASGGFRIQVLSVSSRADADAEAARLTRGGLPARVEPGNGPRGTVYRVRVGPYATREEAEQAGRRLSTQGRRDTWIVPPGQ